MVCLLAAAAAPPEGEFPVAISDFNDSSGRDGSFDGAEWDSSDDDYGEILFIACIFGIPSLPLILMVVEIIWIVISNRWKKSKRARS